MTHYSTAKCQRPFTSNPNLFFQNTHYLLLNPVGEMVNSYSQCAYFASKSPVFLSPPLLSHITQIQKPVICARKRNWGSGSQKLEKIVPKLAYFMASNLKIFPEPLNMFIGEFSGGGGGGLGFWKGFGGGNFDVWRRKRKRGLGILVVCGLVLLLLFGRELNRDVVLGVLALGLLGAVFTKGHKRGVKEWFFGVFLFGIVMGFGLRRQDMQKWVGRHRICSPVSALMKRKRRNGRRFL